MQTETTVNAATVFGCCFIILRAQCGAIVTALLAATRTQDVPID